MADSIESVRRHYGIGGTRTVQNWLRKYGKNQIRQMKQQILKLEQALGQTQAENLLNAAFLEMACEELDSDVNAFKKKSTRRSSPSKKRGVASER